MQLIRTLAAWQPDLGAYRGVEAAYRIGLKTVARRCMEPRDEIADLASMSGNLVDELAPERVARNSIGRTGTAQLQLTAGDNPEGLRSEAGFPASCDVSPVPASCGKTVGHRRNRGGDCAANSALHILAIGRRRTGCADQGVRGASYRGGPLKTGRVSPPETLLRSRGVDAHHPSAAGDQPDAHRRLTHMKGVQGSPSTTGPFQRLMAEHGIVCSMSRSGNVWHDAAMESFVFSPKSERTARPTDRGTRHGQPCSMT